MPATGFVPTFHGRCRGTQNAQCVIQTRAVQRQIAPVVARRFRLFIGRFVFFIDNDQAELFKGQKHCRARSQNYIDRPVKRSLPYPHALAIRKPTVPKTDANAVCRQTCFYFCQRLSGKQDFGHQIKCLQSEIFCLHRQRVIKLGFPRARHTEQHMRRKFPRPQRRSKFLENVFLLVGQRQQSIGSSTFRRRLFDTFDIIFFDQTF